MKRALVVQHMNHDHPGRFLDWFAEDDIIPHQVRMFDGEDIPSLAGFDLMFVLGGSQDTWQEQEYPYLAKEKAAIREWVWDRAKPYFGVCLGIQLLATALGGEVALAEKSEVGVFDVTVDTDEGGFFAGLNPRQRVMEWHHAEVKRIPQSSRVLASSKDCAVQALAINDHALATQFHCEFSPQTVATWNSLPSYLAVLDKELGPGGYERFKAEAWPLMPEMTRNTRVVWENFKKKSGLKT
jgi:GMP synthase-like glutamine amidotransferase